jgi:hypothetical protein
MRVVIGIITFIASFLQTDVTIQVALTTSATKQLNLIVVDVTMSRELLRQFVSQRDNYNINHYTIKFKKKMFRILQLLLPHKLTWQSIIGGMIKSI